MKKPTKRKKKHNKKNLGRAMLLPYWPTFPEQTDIDFGDHEFYRYVLEILRRGKVPGYSIPYNDN